MRSVWADFFLSSIRLFCIAFILFSQSVAANPPDFLDELIQQALASYPSILSRQAGRDAAQMDLLAAKLKFLPSPAFSTQRNQVNFDGATASGRMPSTNITVTQPLLIDGGIIAGYQKADARLSAADFALLEAREEIGRRIITTYSEWLKAWLKIKALEESSRVHEKLVGLITRRYEQGVASGADKDLGYSRLHQVQADLDAQRSLAETAMTALAELVGKPIPQQHLTKKLAQAVSPPKRNDGVLRAQINSVTIQRNKFEAEAAEQEANEIKAQARPQLAFQAQRQVGNAYFPGAQGFNAVGIVVNYALGGGLSNIASASAAGERSRAAGLQVETSKRELNDRINAEYSEYEFSVLKRENLQRSATLSEDISASYDRQYMVGRKSWLDLMNAVRERAQTKVQLADVDASLVASSRRLMIYVDGTQQYGGLEK